MPISNFQMIIKIIKSLLPFLIFTSLASSIEVEQDLPPLIQNSQPDIVKAYQVQQKQTFNLYNSPQSQVVGKLYKQCHSHDAYISIQNNRHFDLTNKETKYLYNSKYHSLMILNQTEMVMQPLDQSTQRQVFKFSNNCSKDMVLDFGEQKAFIFSCEAIFSVGIFKNNLTITSLTKNQQILDISKTLRFKQLVIVITLTKGVFIYGIDLSLTLQRIARTQINSNQIVDAFYTNNRLMLLDLKKGIMYYKRQGSNLTKVDEFALQLQQQIQYKYIQIWQNTTFLCLQAETQSMVVQLQQIDGKIYLIRYYKGYDQILKMQVVNNSLIIHSNYQIDVFPINRDPRVIKSLNNGYTYLHDQSIVSFYYLYHDIFLVQKLHSSIMARWIYEDKKIECEFKQTGVYTIMVEQLCQSNQNKPFNHGCLKLQIAEITVYHKDTYIWLLLIFIGVFIAITLFLIYWREGKVVRIVRILKQIKEFQLKKKQIEFKQIDLNEEAAKEKAWSEQPKNEQKQQDEEMDPYQEYINSQRNNLT